MDLFGSLLLLLSGAQIKEIMGSKCREIEERKREKEAEAIREMDRNREARRVPMAAAGNGLSRRRHRAGSFRDSPGLYYSFPSSDLGLKV